MRMKWLIAPALMLAMVGGLGGAALAQESDASVGASVKSFTGRLAEKLGINEATVQSAMEEVRADVESEMIDRKLAVAVEKGFMTQEQADEYRSWYSARPSGPSISQFGGRHGFNGHGRHGGPKFGDRRMFGSGTAAPAPAPEPAEATSV